MWLASLRRILRAFAAFSSSREVESGLPACSYPIGYAQSLNYIAGLLLLVFARCYRTFPESETATVLLIGYFEQEDLALLPADAISRIERLVFATMCCMVDKLMPIGMYNDPDLAGGLLEQDVFWDGLLDGRAGQLGLSPYRTWWLAMEKGVVRKRIFSRKKGELEPFPGSLKIVTFAWMLTMFVDSMPVEVISFANSSARSPLTQTMDRLLFVFGTLFFTKAFTLCTWSSWLCSKSINLT